jgi:hypothetical protein
MPIDLAKLPPLAQRVLADHRRAPNSPFYDLFALGGFADTGDVASLDDAYAALERSGLVERVEGGQVSFGGNVRPMFRLAQPAAPGQERRSA